MENLLKFLLSFSKTNLAGAGLVRYIVRSPGVYPPFLWHNVCTILPIRLTRLSCSACRCISRAWRYSKCCWYCQFARWVLNPFGKQYLAEYSVSLCYKWYCASNVGRRNRLWWTRDSIRWDYCKQLVWWNRLADMICSTLSSMKCFQNWTTVVSRLMVGLLQVHERTIESDFLLIVLKTLLEQRSDLKRVFEFCWKTSIHSNIYCRVILMSATVDADKLSSFFGGCPVIHVPGRTFPVDVKFLEDTVEYTKWTISESSPYARRGEYAFTIFRRLLIVSSPW